MTVKTASRYLDLDIKDKAEKATKKGAKTIITKVDGLYKVNCYAFNRLVGKMWVQIDNKKAKAISKTIVEKDFFPIELMIVEVCKELTKSKVKELEI